MNNSPPIVRGDVDNMFTSRADWEIFPNLAFARLAMFPFTITIRLKRPDHKHLYTNRLQSKEA